MTAIIGDMPMPAGFRYADVYKRGKPYHGTPNRLDTYDIFYLRHPPMETSKRAKIFAPFDALHGYSERIEAKKIRYECRRELTTNEAEDLNTKMMFLLKRTSRHSRPDSSGTNVRITYFTPCTDPENDAFGTNQGIYETVEGTVQRIDPIKRILILDTEKSEAEKIDFNCILKIENDSVLPALD